MSKKAVINIKRKIVKNISSRFDSFKSFYQPTFIFELKNLFSNIYAFYFLYCFTSKYT